MKHHINQIIQILLFVFISGSYGCGDVPIIKSWTQVSGNHGFDQTETYCNEMDRLASAKAAETLSDLFVYSTASLSGMTGYQKGKNARQPTPDGMPFVTCMQKYGWQPNY